MDPNKKFTIYFKKRWFLLLKRYTIKFLIVIFLCFISYRFFLDLKEISDYKSFLLSIVPSFVISYLISSFVLNKFKYSEYLIIRLLQKFIFLILCIISGYFFLYIFLDVNFNIFADSDNDSDSNLDIEEDHSSPQSRKESPVVNENSNIKGKDLLNIKVEKDNNNEYYNARNEKNIMDNTIEKVGNLLINAAEKVAPNLRAGAFSAAGSATAAMIKATGSFPPFQRAGAIAGTAFITSATSKIGLGVGSSILKNSDILSSIEKSKHSDPDISRIPSPDMDNNLINSIIENGEIVKSSPLEELFYYQFVLNVFILILIISLLIIIFNRFVLISNLNIISSLFDKYMPNKLNELFKRSVNNGNVYNDRFFFIIYIIISIVLIFIIILNIIISAELLVNNEKYIEVYNYIHNKKT